MALQDAETLMEHMSKEAPALLNRLFKAAKAYYLMKEGGMKDSVYSRHHADLVQEEMAAALVAVKMITENVEEEGHSLVYKMEKLSQHADRRREWGMAKLLADGGFKPGKSILLEPGESIEFETKTRLP